MGKAWVCIIDKDYPTFVSIKLGEGSSSLGFYEWEAAAQDAGVSSEGSGFRGVSFHYIVSSREAVDEVMGNAVAAGGSIVKAAAAALAGYGGYFSDPDGIGRLYLPRKWRWFRMKEPSLNPGLPALPTALSRTPVIIRSRRYEP